MFDFLPPVDWVDTVDTPYPSSRSDHEKISTQTRTPRAFCVGIKMSVLFIYIYIRPSDGGVGGVDPVDSVDTPWETEHDQAWDVMQISLRHHGKQAEAGPMTRAEITVRNADPVTDKAFLKDANYAYLADALNETGALPRGGLLLSRTMANLICRGTRRVGAFSLAADLKDDRSTEVQVDTMWILPKFRGRGYSEQALRFLRTQTQWPVALRAPVHPALQKVAARVGVRVCEESAEDAAAVQRELEAGLRLMQRDCPHATFCRPCLLAALTKVNDVSWDLEELKLRRMGEPWLTL